MDRRPIGVFDTGLGGLTAVRELTRLLPGEDIVYFGDTGRVPYGNRSRDTIIKYARQDVAFLRTFDLKAIVIACGTVSTTALEVLEAENSIPILGVMGPSVAEAATATRNGKVGLIATQATIRTHAYEKALARLMPKAEVTALACPLLVPLVENGRFRPGDQVPELVVAEYLAPIKAAGVDTLVLGCTHYPLLTDIIRAYMGPDVTLVNSGAACARQVASLLEENGGGRPGVRRYFVSDRVDDFSTLASVFLGEDVRGDVEQVDITLY
ncbi:Glutamate racemase [uncultured Eubacteriales bacterium]|uniref:Glutamate racemase n=1 Tax=uncultured Eubacteriales bacterium TaxID=172733 RepID=A0A212KDD9_9FIRM|nr:Glutamate racemase [uncultured Eubacteriales bacterium]